MDLIAACDFRYCSREAKFSLREVRVGITADLGALQRLPRIIGEGHTRELAYTGGDVDSDRALQMGLVNQVFATPEELLAAARATARKIADNPPLVVQGARPRSSRWRRGRRAPSSGIRPPGRRPPPTSPILRRMQGAG